jgi:hypothetical protein
MVMNINGIGSTSSTDAVGAIDSSHVSTAAGAPVAASTPAASAEISKNGELLSKLQQLLQQDPGQFKRIASSIAENLRSAAQQSGGDGSSFLGKLADRFDQAAQTGDLSPLQPQNEASGSVQGHHHHHGHHGGGGAIASIFENALNDVNQVLSAAPPTTASTTATNSATSSAPA